MQGLESHIEGDMIIEECVLFICFCMGIILCSSHYKWNAMLIFNFSSSFFLFFSFETTFTISCVISLCSQFPSENFTWILDIFFLLDFTYRTSS